MSVADIPRRIGLLVAAADRVVEADFHGFLPKRISFHTARLYQSLRSTAANVETLTALANSAEPSAASVARANPELILFACTAASMVKGRGWTREIAGRISALTGIPAISTGEAIASAIDALALKRVFLLTPYPDAVARLVVDFLEAHGITVGGSSAFACPDINDVAALTPAQVRTHILASRAAIQKSDGLAVCGSGVRVLGTIEDLERELGVPIVGSNQALLWLALRRLKVEGSRIPLGRLLQAQLGRTHHAA